MDLPNIKQILYIFRKHIFLKKNLRTVLIFCTVPSDRLQSTTTPDLPFEIIRTCLCIGREWSPHDLSRQTFFWRTMRKLANFPSSEMLFDLLLIFWTSSCIDCFRYQIRILPSIIELFIRTKYIISSLRWARSVAITSIIIVLVESQRSFSSIMFIVSSSAAPPWLLLL